MKLVVNPGVVNAIHCNLPKPCKYYSETIKSLLEDQFDVSISNAPTLHSTSNGHVERFHSTLSEIARYLKLGQKISSKADLILVSTVKYNRTIHSLTNKRAIDIIHFSSPHLEREIIDRVYTFLLFTFIL